MCEMGYDDELVVLTNRPTSKITGGEVVAPRLVPIVAGVQFRVTRLYY